MKICGLQKTTLLDYPGKLACTMFTGGCNFACPYCHNAGLVVGDPFDAVISEPDFFAFLEKRRGVLDGVCITGGEPLIHKDLPDVIRRVKDLGFLVKLDTNGSFPAQLKDLVKSGLVDYVAMDIKHAKSSYGRAVGRSNVDLEKIEESLQFLMEGTVDFEFRTTAVKGMHRLQDFEEIGTWIRGDEKYFIQNFEDSGDILAARKPDHVEFEGFSAQEINEFREKIRHNVGRVKVRGL